MEPGDLDLAARRLRARAGFDEWAVALPGTIAEALFGDDGYEVVHGLGICGELLVWDGGGKVRVDAGLSGEEQDFAAGHELGHYADHLESWGLSGVQLERACDVFAAAIMMPPAPFMHALELFGDAWSEIAPLFGATETAVALRAGELTGRPIAVVGPLTCRARGEAQWPEEQTLRAWRSKPGPRIVAARLRDDPRRVVLTPRGPKTSTG